MRTDTITLPSYWASALVNGEDSSFDINDDETADRERQLLADTVGSLRDSIGPFSVVDVGDPYFTRNFHHYVEGDISPITGGDVADYLIVIHD